MTEELKWALGGGAVVVGVGLPVIAFLLRDYFSYLRGQLSKVDDLEVAVGKQQAVLSDLQNDLKVLEGRNLQASEAGQRSIRALELSFERLMGQLDIRREVVGVLGVRSSDKP